MGPFELLGLSESASPAEVKAAWRQLAAIHHPDRGGDQAEFDKLRKAYDEALAEATEAKPCLVCEGTGKMVITHGWDSLRVTCSICEGTGLRQQHNEEENNG